MGSAGSDSDNGSMSTSRSRSRSASPLALGREKRSTAGNMMRFLLDEESMQEHLAADEFFAEVENDEAFDESSGDSDDFDSDFNSTDDEAYMQEGVDGLRNANGQPLDGNEDELKEQARAARKFAREKAKGYAPVVRRAGDRRAVKKKSHEDEVDHITDIPRKRSRNGVTIQASSSQEQAGRKSSRASTVLTVSKGIRKRTEASLLKKAIQSSKLQAPTTQTQHVKSQAELIAEALDMEGFNRASLQQFYAQEADRKERSRKIKVDPLAGQIVLRWTSKTVEGSHHVEAQEMPATEYRSASRDDSQSVGSPIAPFSHVDQYKGEFLTLKSGEIIQIPAIPFIPAVLGAPSTIQTGNDYTRHSSDILQEEPVGATIISMKREDAESASLVTAIPGVPEVITKKHTLPDTEDTAQARLESRNFLTFLNLHPTSNTYDIMNHLLPQADWRNVKVATSKYKPREKSRSMCSLTNLLAKYRDPITGTPYANAEAFKIIRQLIADEWTWSPQHNYFSEHTSKDCQDPHAVLTEQSQMTRDVEGIKARDWSERYGDEFDCLNSD